MNETSVILASAHIQSQIFLKNFNRGSDCAKKFSITPSDPHQNFSTDPGTLAKTLTPEKMSYCKIIIQQLDNYPTVGRLSYTP